MPSIVLVLRTVAPRLVALAACAACLLALPCRVYAQGLTALEQCLLGPATTPAPECAAYDMLGDGAVGMPAVLVAQVGGTPSQQPACNLGLSYAGAVIRGTDLQTTFTGVNANITYNPPTLCNNPTNFSASLAWIGVVTQAATPDLFIWAQVGWARGQNAPARTGPADERPLNQLFAGRYYEIKSIGAYSNPNTPASVYILRFFAGSPPVGETYYNIDKFSQSASSWLVEIPGLAATNDNRGGSWAGRVLDRTDCVGEVKKPPGDRMPGSSIFIPVAFSNCVLSTVTNFRSAEFYLRSAASPGNTVLTNSWLHGVRVHGAPGSDQVHIFTR